MLAQPPIRNPMKGVKIPTVKVSLYSSKAWDRLERQLYPLSQLANYAGSPYSYISRSTISKLNRHFFRKKKTNSTILKFMFVCMFIIKSMNKDGSSSPY